MSQAGATLSLKAAARTVEAVLRRLLAPGLIAGLLVGFLALTYLAAELVARLLDQSTTMRVLLLWAGMTALGIVLVRQLPRVL